MTYLDNVGAPDSFVSVTPLKTGNRADWHVLETKESAGLPVPFAETGIIDQLRMFFDRLEAEAEMRRDDPIAMVNVLARMEALLADMRTVTAMIRTYTADALSDRGIRRITIDNVATMEGTSEATRTDWEDQRLLRDMLTSDSDIPRLVDADSGEVVDHDELAQVILRWFRVQWRLTPIREVGLDPDDYSHLPTDEDGKAMRTPTVRVHDNQFRKQDVV